MLHARLSYPLLATALLGFACSSSSPSVDSGARDDGRRAGAGVSGHGAGGAGNGGGGAGVGADAAVIASDAAALDGPPRARACSTVDGGAGVQMRELSRDGIHRPFNAMLGRLGREIVFVTWHLGSHEVTAYDPIANAWRDVALPNGGPTDSRLNPYLGVAQGRLVVYGGRENGFASRWLQTGATFDFATTTWRTTSKTGAPLFDPAPMVGRWIFDRGGKTLFVAHLGDDGGESTAHAGAVYDAATDVWTPFPAQPVGYSCGETPPVEGPRGVACAGHGRVFLVDTTGVTELPPIPDAQKYATKVALEWVGDQLLVAALTERHTANGEGEPIEWTALYDFANARYVRIAPPPFVVVPPVDRDEVRFASVEGRLVALGAASLDGSERVGLAWSAYDRTANRWSTPECLQLPLTGVSNRFVVGDELLLSGVDGSNAPALVALRFPH